MVTKNTSTRETKANLVIKTTLWLIAGAIFQVSLNYLGLVVGLFWIWKKVQQNKLPRLIAFLVGFCIALFGLPMLEKQTDQYLNTNYPEFNIITEKVSSAYPNSLVGVSSQQKQGDNNEQENTLVVSVRASNLTDQDVTHIAQITCEVIKSVSKPYTHVTIKKVSGVSLPFINFESSLDIIGTCEEWLSPQ